MTNYETNTVEELKKEIEQLKEESRKWQRKYQNYVVHHAAVMKQITTPEPEPVNYTHFDYAIEAIQTKYPYFTRQMAIAQTRKREAVICRQIAMHLVYNASEISLKSAGKMFGGRDHSTVIHACQVVDDVCDVDKYFRADFEKIQDKFNELLRL